MEKSGWIKQLFSSIDDRDTDTFIGFLDEEVLFRFGNADPVKGKTTVGEIIGGFFESIMALHHEILETWVLDNTIICHGVVTYTHHDGSTLTVPFANIFKMESTLIKEYLIYVDISELYKSD